MAQGVKVTLEEAANFIAEQARELTAIHLIGAISKENLNAFQKQADLLFAGAQSGWKKAHQGYQRKKDKYAPNAAPGVLSGAWKDFRTLKKAEFVLKEPKTTHDMVLQPLAINPTSAQKAIKRHFTGTKGANSKAWVNYPQRRIAAPADNFFKPVEAQALPAAKGNDYNSLMASLPLYGVKWRSLNKKGTKVGRINGRRVAFTGAFKRFFK